jgi:hypothetical protein
MKGPAGGFLVPAGSVISNIGFNSQNSVPAKFAIYSAGNALLAETEEVTTGNAGDELVPLTANWTPATDTYVFIAALTSSYLTGLGEETNLRFMPYAARTYANGFPATFSQAGTANTPKQALWLDGTPASASPSVALANDLQPGASFTLNYSNYAAVPVSPVTIRDSNNNSITVPVTINDNGDGTGTATGTMPSLPSSGTSQGLLFGNVTVELGT